MPLASITDTLKKACLCMGGGRALRTWEGPSNIQALAVLRFEGLPFFTLHSTYPSEAVEGPCRHGAGVAGAHVGASSAVDLDVLR